MFKAVIEGPMSGKRVKDIIFDIPSAVTCVPELTTRKFRERESSRPPPVMVFNVFEPFIGNPSVVGARPRDAVSSGRISLAHPEARLSGLP
jgi:hypothetical protein